MMIWWGYPHNYIQYISSEAEIIRLGMEQSRVNLRGSTKAWDQTKLTFYPTRTWLSPLRAASWLTSECGHVKRRQGAGIPVRTCLWIWFDFFHQRHSTVVRDSECMHTQLTDRENPSQRPIMKWPLCPITLGETTLLFPCDLGEFREDHYEFSVQAPVLLNERKLKMKKKELFL